MSSEEHGRNRVISRLFAMAMTRLEEGAALALDGQGHDCADRTRIANQIIDLGEDIQTIAEAIVVIADNGPNAQNPVTQLG